MPRTRSGTAAQVASEHGLLPWRVEALFGLGTCELKSDERSPSLLEARDLAGEIGLLGQQGQAEMLLADRAFLTDGPSAVVEPAALLRDRGALLGMPVFAFVSELLLATRDALAGDRRAMEERLGRMETLESDPAGQPSVSWWRSGPWPPWSATICRGQDAARRVGAAAWSSTARRPRCSTSGCGR